MKVIVVIPCLNEMDTIADLVTATSKFVDMVIVADDNSEDETATKAKEAGAYVVCNIGKRGFGNNMKSGIGEALIKGCDVVVTLDGDGQHDPTEMPEVLSPIERGEADVVASSRFLRKNHRLIPKYRKIGIKIITLAYNLGSKQKVTDSQCCFRAYRREVLKNMVISEGGFTFSTEILIKARALGYRIKEVPVSVIYHKKLSQNSTLNPIIHGLGVLVGTIRVRIMVELLNRIKGKRC